MSLTFGELQAETKEWASRNFPNTKPYQPLLGIVEEVGELAHAHLKMEQGIRDVSDNDKVDAVGDIIVFLADYCNRNSIDLQYAIEKTWSEVRKRDWLNNPRDADKL